MCDLRWRLKKCQRHGFNAPRIGSTGQICALCEDDQDDMKPSKLVIFTSKREMPVPFKASCSSTEVSCLNYDGCYKRSYEEFSVYMEHWSEQVLFWHVIGIMGRNRKS